MAQPFLGELKMVGFNFPPRGWAFANGQLLPIAQNAALFSLLGTTYGGDGIRTFALPNMQGRLPLHMGNGFSQGQSGGEEGHTLTVPEIPSHSHALPAQSAAAVAGVGPGSASFATATTQPYRTGGGSFVTTNDSTDGGGGGNQPHPNLEPYLVLSFIIALQGVFPSRN